VLIEPDRTRYDLWFRLFGFSVRIHPLFWVGAALFGAWTVDLGALYLLIWVGSVFVSILVHELGHAVAFRWLGGVRSYIVLYIFGGLAVPQGDVDGRWRRILVALAGPFAGFALCAAVYYSNVYLYPWAAQGRPLFALFLFLVSINLFWNVINLLPVFPLDGGRVSMEVCAAVWRRRGARVALEISIAVAGLVALYSLACVLERGQDGGFLTGNLPGWVPRGTLWTALLFGILAYQSYQLLQQLRWTEAHWVEDDDRPPWKS
jgi:Zn-dependent protease